MVPIVDFICFFLPFFYYVNYILDKVLKINDRKLFYV